PLPGSPMIHDRPPLLAARPTPPSSSRPWLPALLCALALGLAGSAQAAPGDIDTIAGTGVAGDAGDEGPAVAALLKAPSKAARNPATGALYFADAGNDRMRRIDPDGTIHAVAGTGVPGFGGDGGPATAALLKNPQGIAVERTGGGFVADTG